VLTNDIDDFSIYSAVILAVAHDSFQTLKLEQNEGLVVYDVKGILPRTQIDGRL
jgi:UDP-N-acetyl-D-galactosamine dehydrogenase